MEEQTEEKESTREDEVKIDIAEVNHTTDYLTITLNGKDDVPNNVTDEPVVESDNHQTAELDVQHIDVLTPTEYVNSNGTTVAWETPIEHKPHAELFARTLPLAVQSLEESAANDSHNSFQRATSPRAAFIGQRGSKNVNSTEQSTTSPQSSHSTSPKTMDSPTGSRRTAHKGGSAKLPPHKMLMNHAHTSKYMSHNRGSSNIESPNTSKASSPTTSPTPRGSTAIVDGTNRLRFSTE